MLGLGQSGEKRAAQYLMKKGYSIVTVNYRCKYGEIDIIASKDGVTVFVEVKTRTSKAYGLGYESVNEKKQQKLILTAQNYFRENGESQARFDVISIDAKEITHIENAFGL